MNVIGSESDRGEEKDCSVVKKERYCIRYIKKTLAKRELWCVGDLQAVHVSLINVINFAVI